MAQEKTFSKYPAIRNNAKMEKLCELLDDYFNFVNPFGITNANFVVSVSVNYIQMKFEKAVDEWEYMTTIEINKHYLETGFYHDPYGYIGVCADDFVYFKYRKDEFYQYPNDIDLNISLKTAESWNSQKQQSEPATDEEIENMIRCFQISLEKMKKALGGI